MQKTLTRKLLLHKISIQLNVHFMQKLALAFCTECTIVLAYIPVLTRCSGEDSCNVDSVFSTECCHQQSQSYHHLPTKRLTPVAKERHIMYFVIIKNNTV